MSDAQDALKAAWDRWWAADFSWAGLAQKPVGNNLGTIHGGLHGEKTLQDYWRRDPATGAVRDDAALMAAGELIDCDGVLFHLAHLPAQSKAGAPTWKVDPEHADWARLDALIAARLDAGAETNVDVAGHALGPDGRAQFAGAVLSGASHPQGKELHLEASQSIWLSVEFAGVAFGPSARFVSASFLAFAGFDRAFFGGYASFDGASFAGNADFDSASFAGDASFVSASFARNAGFVSASFAGNASFASASLAGDASFYRASFAGVAWFDSACFAGDAWFVSASFAEDAWFDSASFAGNASFALAAFAGRVSFVRTRFQRTANFLGQGALLKDRDRRATLTLPAEGAREGAIDQKGDVTPRAQRVFLRADFEHTIFEGDAIFSNRDFLEPSSFRGAVFHGMAEFHGGALHQGQTFHGARLDDVIAAPWPQERAARLVHRVAGALAELSRLDRKRPSRPPPFEKWRTASKASREGQDHWLFARPMSDDARYESIEAAFRSLKLAMEGVRNRVEEQRYYRLELLARQRRRDIPAWERVASRIYGRISDFGNSLERPFWTLLGVLAAFAAVYAGWAALLGVKGVGVWDALTFSAGRVAPFGPWGESPWLQSFDTLGAAWGFAARVVATIESACAIVLAFLFALAVRRRFQIT